MIGLHGKALAWNAFQAVWGDSMAFSHLTSSMSYWLCSKGRELCDVKMNAVWLLSGMPSIRSKIQHGYVRMVVVGGPHLTGLRDVHEMAATRVKYTFAMRLQAPASQSKRRVNDV